MRYKQSKLYTTRKTVLKNSLTLDGSILLSVNAAGKSDNQSGQLSIADVAIESLEHPDHPLAAFTTTFIDDEYQLYITRGSKGLDSPINSAKRVTDANAGVHGLSWVSDGENPVLRYSMDDATFEGAFRGKNIVDETKVRDKPLTPRVTPLSTEQTSGSSVVTLSTRRYNYCINLPFVGKWCANARGPEVGRLRCDNVPGDHTPPIEHYQFEILRSGNATSGISFWLGQQTTDNCFWVGEENFTQWCWSYCNGDGIPGVNTLANAIEKAINKAADAAGIAIPAAIVAALAYAITIGVVVKPPIGVPV